MKKLFFIAFALMLSFTTALAEKKDVPKEEPSAKGLEQDRGGGGGGNVATCIYMFVSKCGKIYTYTSSRELTSTQIDYLQGWYDAQCDKQQWQTI